ncbi:sodium/calcium exchanger NCL2 [Selaginella moellendorffii]|uniref:sodium/calcium exchanger NCL2 n=1 Tax=Selaginella moellendorffii TaxID=88036 RepID=UPI000D1C2239|nr:sodium/calcium exchanger NCL2 [Selaginella moellendorffii]|eukprot:XP_024543095.1 sodium/calcium exchanger NCL2 [Selaginella moellendorffii]
MQVETADLLSLLRREGKACQESYGIFPCSEKLGGSVFLLIVYSYAFVKAAQLLLNGSELLLEIAHPGIVGGLCLPIICTIPDAAVILVSGIFGDKETAQSQVMIGMGVLAGSTVLLLTMLWGTALIVGRCDLYEINGHKYAREKTLTKGFHLTETGVTLTKQTTYVAWILVLSVLPCIVVQLPQILGAPALSRVFVIIGSVMAFLGFVAYCVYQVMTPWIQQVMVDWHRHRYRRSHALHRAHIYSRQKRWGDLLLNGEKLLNYEVLRRLFHFFDQNGDGLLSERELKNFIKTIGLTHDSNIPEGLEAKIWMEEFDHERDGKLSLVEFEEGMANWLNSSKLGLEFVKHRSFKGDRTTSGHWAEIAKEAQSSLYALLEDEEVHALEDTEDPNGVTTTIQEVDVVEEPPPSTLGGILVTATACLLGGMALACIFAAPLVDTIDDFSRASHIPAFFVSFVVTPIATSSSEVISSITFASKKQKRGISVTYSQLYGSVVLNNTLCLGLFLAIVAARGLVWDFSAEVLIMALATMAMGCVGGLFTTIPLFMAFGAFLLYPLSLGLVVLLNQFLGWH